MPARVDLDASERPWDIIHRIYGTDFLLRLGQQFKFNEKDPEIASRIKRMGVSYIFMRRQENREDIQAENKRYNKLAREIQVFKQALDSAADLYLPELIYFSALQLHQPRPGGDFPGLTPHELEQSGEPYFREFMRLLEIMENAVKEHKKWSTAKPGPRVNAGLQVVALQSTQFFAIELKGRPFTIDPQKPLKPTTAFDFVKSIVEPLDAVTDDEIVTAIRSAKTPIKKRHR